MFLLLAVPLDPSMSVICKGVTYGRFMLGLVWFSLTYFQGSMHVPFPLFSLLHVVCFTLRCCLVPCSHAYIFKWYLEADNPILLPSSDSLSTLMSFWWKVRGVIPLGYPLDVVGIGPSQSLDPDHNFGVCIWGNVGLDSVFQFDIICEVCLSTQSSSEFRIQLPKVKTHICTRLLKWYIWSTSLYRSETWTLKKVTEKWVRVFKFWCYRRMLKSSWITKTINNETMMKDEFKKSTIIWDPT